MDERMGSAEEYREWIRILLDRITEVERLRKIYQVVNRIFCGK